MVKIDKISVQPQSRTAQKGTCLLASVFVFPTFANEQLNKSITVHNCQFSKKAGAEIQFNFTHNLIVCIFNLYLCLKTASSES